MADDDQHDNGDDFDPKMMEHFASFLDQREETKRKQAEKRKAPKDFGEFVDRVADAVLDRAEERAANRRKAADEHDDDDEPSRGSGDKSGFAKFWGG